MKLNFNKSIKINLRNQKLVPDAKSECKNIENQYATYENFVGADYWDTVC